MADINFTTNTINTQDTHRVKDYLTTLQAKICEALHAEDGQGHFISDNWERREGGGGVSKVYTQGSVFEKAGVNFSDVSGLALPPTATQSRPELTGRSFRAMGVSVVVHPHNPYVPTSHANVRFFIAEKPNSEPVWWFGGGFDLTPYYGFVEDAIHWHQTAKAACAPFADGQYAKYKAACDRYFYIEHRHEPRGIGGLFFDDYRADGFEQALAFMQHVGNHYMPAYRPIVAKRKHTVFSDREKQFQLYRRGRYVEFNLVYDRGTLFGLQSGGRVESILMSLPPLVRFDYNYEPQPRSPEAQLQAIFLKPRDWASLGEGEINKLKATIPYES